MATQQLESKTGELATTNDHPLMVFLKSPEIVSKFELACGKQAGSVIINIINAANTTPAIWECDPGSVVTAALNISTLGLSLAPGVGQACILPYTKNKKVNNVWVQEKKAQAVIMLRGVKTMALRTNKYRVLNAFKVYEGQEWVEDQMSGLGKLAGQIVDKKNVIGYGAYLLLFNGFEATVYKTKDEVLRHGAKYSPSWDKEKQEFKKGSRWLTDFDEQGLKTVMKDLILNHGEISAQDREALEQIERVEEGADFDIPTDSDTEIEHKDVIEVQASRADQVDVLFPQARPSTDVTQNVDIMNASSIQHLVDLRLFENGFSAATVLGRFNTKKMPLKRLEEMATDYRDWKVLLEQTVGDPKEATSQAIAKVNAGEKPNTLPGM